MDASTARQPTKTVSGRQLQRRRGTRTAAAGAGMKTVRCRPPAAPSKTPTPTPTDDIASSLSSTFRRYHKRFRGTRNPFALRTRPFHGCGGKAETHDH
ncbi:hypothetical protein AB0N87_26610 [Streptomyces sp. NPDC093228]|uniref:hypothetical protein n=1 Tax=Streptomyces sp. NPDC093228 TaxID=3155070 RepID=UPI00341D1B3C